jgi:hypothetical protein
LREPGAHRKHYFRQFQAGSWTPWTEVKIDCEDIPINPIVWNNRLFLFWIKALKQGPSAALPPGNGSTDNQDGLTLDQLKGFVHDFAQAAQPQNTTVQAVLCWSEFYNGKWQPAKTSDIHRPAGLGTIDANAFDLDRNPWTIDQVIKNTGLPQDALALTIYSTLTPGDNGGFVLYNSHSLPVRFEDASLQVSDFPAGSRIRGLGPILPYTGQPLENGYIAITYQQYLADGTPGQPFTKYLIGLSQVPRFVEASQPVLDFWEAPFFFEDRRNLLRVATQIVQTPLAFYNRFGILAKSIDMPASLPKIPLLECWVPQKRSLNGKENPTGAGIRLPGSLLNSVPDRRPGS